jgi:hypothetical protein
MIGRTGAVLLVLAASMSHVGGEVFYPWRKSFVGALDSGGLPGVVLALDEKSAFAFVIKIEKDGEVAERDDFFHLIAEVGPHSPDDLYARLRFDLGLPFGLGLATPVLKKPPRRQDTLTLEWSRRDEQIVIGRIICPKNVRLEVTHYFPWSPGGRYDLRSDGQIQGRSGGGEDKSYLFWSSRAGTPVPARPAERALAFDTLDERTLHFVAAAGDDPEILEQEIYRYKNPGTIDAFIEEEAAGYEQKRLKIKGLFRGLPEAITNSVHWSLLYQPGLHRLYVPSSRDAIAGRADRERGQWLISEAGSFFTPLELALESSRLAVDAAMALLETQFPNGNVPSRRDRFGGTPDRSQPPVGAFVVLKLFLKLGDMDFLRAAYPYLQKWNGFWTARQANGLPRRDGNNDGLLEWGSDSETLGDIPGRGQAAAGGSEASGRQRAAWESGQKDLPNWDGIVYNNSTDTLALNCLDLNCLYALDCACLSEVAKILGHQGDAGLYSSQYERHKKLINDKLWNDSEGFYFDRHWSGGFSSRKAASNLYALTARIPDETRAREILKHLLNPREFWGDYVLPSISRDDPSFRADDQQGQRGTIWAPANYLVYQGLKAYGFDAVASELARKSADLFVRTWTHYQISPEYFNSLTGEAGGGRHLSWSPLLGLPGVEEYLDFTPWEGFRFGMIKPDQSGKLSRLFIQGRHYEVELSGSRTVLREEGETIVSADGPAVFRRFLYNDAEVSFEIKTLDSRVIRIRFLKKGRYQLVLDGETKDVFRGADTKFEIPAGGHTVLVQLLSDLEKQG